MLDLGAGLPLDPSVYATARASGYPVTVAYVDKDPDVVNRLTSAVYRETDVAVVEQDISDPARVLADPGVLGVIDLDEPVLILLGATLSSMGAQAARGTVAGYSEMVQPGSAMAISCASFADAELAERMVSLCSSVGSWFNHGQEGVASFFEVAGLRLIRGRVADVRYWPMLHDAGAEAAVIGGMGVKSLWLTPIPCLA